MPTNESRLLLYCAHIRPSDGSREEIEKLLHLPLDWDEILTAAAWHSIKPLLYHSLRGSSARQSVPQEIMRQLKKSYDDIVVRNMYIYATLARLLPLFTQQGIKCIVLKGAMLADTVYGDIGLRPMQDIDLLFNKKDVSRVISILSELGYQHEGSKLPEHYLDRHHHITYTHPDTDIPIEVHWHIAHDRHPGRLRLTDADLIEAWFERARPVTLSNIETWSLCPSDLLFHLCLHFLKHRVAPSGGIFVTSAGLLQLVDMARVINYYDDEMDWEQLCRQAEKYKITDLIAVTLQLAREVCLDQGIKNEADNFPFRWQAGDFEYKGLMHKRLTLYEDMTQPLPGEMMLPARLRNLRVMLRGVARWLLPAKPVLAQRYAVPETSRRMYFYYLMKPCNLTKTIMLFMQQRPRLKEERKLNKWISG